MTISWNKVMKAEFILTSAIIAILLTTIIPATFATTSTLEVTNLDGDTYNFTHQQLTEMPQTTMYAEIYCYGSLVGCGDWSGVQLSYLLSQTNTNSEVKSLQLTASDSYTVQIPLQLALAPETIIAYQKDGVQLTGLRLVLPGFNGAAWIDNIISITMSTSEVDLPPAASGAGARGNLVTNIVGNEQAPPTPTSIPEKTQPTSDPAPINSTQNPVVPPVNITRGEPTPKQQTTDDQSMLLDRGKIAVIVAVFAISLGIAATVAYKSKSKLRK